MRRFIIIGLVGGLLTSTSISLAHTGPWAWPEWKATKMVKRDAKVRLPAAERTALEGELRASVRLFGSLAYFAFQEQDGAAALYASYYARYKSALDGVERGVRIETASCKGSGSPLSGRRFKHFGCAVTSALLEIPTTELDYGDREFPLVIEGTPRVLGPWQSQLDVHVAGRAAIAFSQVGQ